MSNRTFSHSALASYIRKIHLEPGDCLLIRNPEVLQQLQRMPAMSFHVPVIFDPEGKGIEKCTRAELLDILERMDEAEAAFKGIT